MSTRRLHVVQVTDTHLFADPKRQLLGVETEVTFRATLGAVKALAPAPDLMLLTGDLSQDGSPESYRRLREQVATIPTQSYWLAGNHDRLGAMEAELHSTVAVQPEFAPLSGAAMSADKVFHRQNWTFILLNSQIPGKDSGYLADDMLSFLSTQLEIAAQAQQHVMVCLHHPPLAMNSEWLDTSTLAEPERLLSVLDFFPQVRAVVFGHVHQVVAQQRRGVWYLGCPSTCIQFKPQSQQFALDLVPPAFRQLWLREDGEIETAVVRVPAALQQPNLRVSGY